AKFGKGKNFGLVYCAESATACGAVYQYAIQEGGAKKAGLNPVYSAQISLAQADFTPQCLQARQAGVELFAVAADANTVARAAASCSRQGYNPQYLDGSISIDAPTASRPGLDGIVPP